MKKTILAALMMTMAIPATCVFAQTADELFQQAIVQERSVGDLRAAIDLYERVISVSTDRSLTARALVQLGKSYETLGLTEALAAYQRVLRDFADQSEMAAEARTRLEALQQQSEAESVPAITIRQIMSGGQEVLDVLSDAAITPDGQNLIYPDWDSNFIVRDLETDDVRTLLVTPAGETSEGMPEGPVVSTNGEWVAYSLYKWDLQRYDLRIIRLDGTESRILYDDETVDWAYPRQWSSDGKQILAGISRKDQHYDIALISVGTGHVRVLNTLERGVWPIGAALSPDQRFVAYSRPVEPGSENWDVYLLPTDGSPEIPLIQNPAEDYVLGWTPDGRYIMFASSRRGILGVFLQPVQEGERSSEAHMVKADMWRVAPIGFTRDGSYYYTQNTSTEDVYVAEIDIDAGTIVSRPAPLFRSRYEGANRNPVLSPDGKFLASIGQRGPEAWWYANRFILNIHSFETGETRRLYTDTDVTSRAVFWFSSPDSLVVLGPNRQRSPCLYHTSATTGHVSKRECWDRETMKPGIFFGFSPDASLMYYTEHWPDDMRIMVRESGADTEKELIKVRVTRSVVALSSDGKQIAFVEGSRIDLDQVMVMSSSGGQARQIAAASDSTAWITSIAFVPDDRGIVYSLRSEQGGAQLWYAPLDGGSTIQLPLEMETLSDLTVHADGRRLFFTSRQQSAELWVMEGFLPDSSSIQ